MLEKAVMGRVGGKGKERDRTHGAQTERQKRGEEREEGRHAIAFML
jgi:hypothetical protein